MSQLLEIFQQANRADASDLHFQTGEPPRWRVHGELRVIEGAAPLAADELRQLVADTLTPAQQQRLEADGEIDCACIDPDGTRYRANYFRGVRGMAVALRRIATRLRTLEELELPDEVEQFAHVRRGLVLVTGATGSGKSSTLAALIDLINRLYVRHIVTLEDPIEFVHQSDRSWIQQRAIHDDLPDFAQGVRDALRQDVDVLMVGELRDLETTRTALSAAETGLLVFGTLHTNDAAQTIDRLIDIFPASEQDQARAMLAESLAGVLSQVLLRRKDQAGRIPATEILVVTPAISALVREGKTHEIPNVLQSGRSQGMHRLDDSLERLLKLGRIDRDEALSVTRSRSRFEKKPAPVAV